MFPRTPPVAADSRARSTAWRALRRPTSRFAAALCAVTALGLLAAPAAADIYTHTDADGVVHFTNKPKGDAKFKLYLKSPERRTRREGVVPVAPSDRSPDRYGRYDQHIRAAATLYQIPEELVRAVIKVESDYDPRAVSHCGAQGLMQLMPETGMRMQVRDAFDPRENIYGGTRYLRILANLFHGDLALTVAGYNAGEGAVVRYGGIPPYAETQGYVTRVLTYYRRYRTTDVALASTSGG